MDTKVRNAMTTSPTLLDARLDFWINESTFLPGAILPHPEREVAERLVRLAMSYVIRETLWHCNTARDVISVERFLEKLSKDFELDPFFAPSERKVADRSKSAPA
jgi:hypothetical protein